MTPMRLAVVLSAAVALGVQEKETPKAQVHAVTVTTASLMTISGTTSFGKIKVTSDLGEHPVDPTKTRSIQFSGSHDQVYLDGSMVSGKVELEEFTLRTEYGTFKIGRAKLKLIQFLGPVKADVKTPAPAKAPPQDPGPSNRLVPAASAMLEIQARELFIVPDESAVLLHDAVTQRLFRFDAETLKRDPLVLDVWKGFRGLRASADRRYILGFGAVEGTVSGGRLVAYDDQGRNPAWQVALDFEPVDVAASPRGRIYILGRNPEPLIAVVDPVARKVVSRWGGMPAGSRILAGADGKRLYIVSDEGSSGSVRTAWLSGPGIGDPLKPRTSPLEGKVRVGSPALLVGRGRFLASGTTVLRVGDLPEDDLKLVGRIDSCDCLGESPSHGLVIASTTSAALKVLGVPGFSVRKSFAPGARLGEMRLDRKGRLFALTAPEFKPGGGPRPALTQLVRYDLAGELDAIAAGMAPAAPREAVPPEPVAIPEVLLKDLAGGRSVEPKLETPAWQPDVKSAQSCPACAGKGRVTIDKAVEDGFILRYHQACVRCAGSGKLDLLTCDACRGSRRIQVAGRDGAEGNRGWIVGETPCGRCAGAGEIGKPQVVAAAEAGKPAPCPACGGAAQVKVQKIKAGYGTEFKGDCLACRGKGKVIRTACVKCRGTGSHEHRLTLELKGRTISLDGQGPCVDCDSTGVMVQAP